MLETCMNRNYGDHLIKHKITTHTMRVPPGEHSKTREVKSTIEDNLFSIGCGRDTLMIALGGGVITDLTGFIAATYCRGIPAIYIPTSLLAMVDAAIGGKTSVNTPFGKNTIGTFTYPLAIFIDIQFLRTLPEPEFLCALSEIIKHALIDDDDYFRSIELNMNKVFNRDSDYLTTVITKSCKIKETIVFDDETEINKREMLNFGHTIAHALEHASQYNMIHGYAVAQGIIAESFISNKMGLLSNEDFKRIETLIDKILDKCMLAIDISTDQIINALKFDKKNRQQMNRFILLQQIGSVFYQDNIYAHYVDESIIKQAINYIYNRSRFAQGEQKIDNTTNPH